MTKALVKTQIRLQQLTAKRESGQGTLEYVGMIIVAAVLVVAVMSTLKNAGFKELLVTQVEALKGAFAG
jgi:hypothetical protein